MSDLIDDQELQRLLDGSLPTEQRTMLLEYAEDHPANWRRIALAFVEEQILRTELKESDFFQNRSTDSVMTQVEVGKGQRQVWTRGLAQAAVVLLMLGAAVWMGRLSVDRPGSETVIGTDVSDQGNVENQSNAGDYTIVLTPEMQTPGDPAMRLAGTGFQDQQDLVERMFTPLFDQQSRVVFHDHGYTVNEEPVIYVVQGQRGEQYVVPRRNVSLVAHRE